MRFIDQEQLMPLVRDHLPALEAARREIEAASPEDRADVLRRRAGVWTALREALSAVSSGKCWYTESKNLGTDDDVDHFRPKSRVDGVVGHPGYYWLAFDWRNFRLSCHHSNRPRKRPDSGTLGGKGARFPLIDEAARAHGPTDDCSCEQPVFLDPCEPADPALLTFGPNGESRVSPVFRGDPVAVHRWEISRLSLHIDWPDFVDARIGLFNEVDRLVDRGARALRAGDGARSPAFKDACRDLIRLRKPDAEFSMAALAFIESYRHEWWIEEIVLKA